MRSLALTLAVAVSPPAPGIYCPLSGETLPILVGASGSIGIEGLDCARAEYTPGRVTSASCYANGGSEVTLDADLAILLDGDLIHDRQFYRRRPEGPPCP